MKRMKKHIAFALALALALSLCACGGEKDRGGEPSIGAQDGPGLSRQEPDGSPAGDTGGAEVEEVPEEREDGTRPDTAGAYLEAFGMTEADLTVDGVTGLTLLGNGDIAVVTEGDPSLELIQAWYEQVYEKCRKRSDDGKVYTQETYNPETGKAEQSEYVLSEQVDFTQDFNGGWGTANTETWVYPSGGETIWVVARWESASAGETLTFLIDCA